MEFIDYGSAGSKLPYKKYIDVSVKKNLRFLENTSNKINNQTFKISSIGSDLQLVEKKLEKTFFLGNFESDNKKSPYLQ